MIYKNGSKRLTVFIEAHMSDKTQFSKAVNPDETA
jgi:hypothetical protein